MNEIKLTLAFFISLFCRLTCPLSLEGLSPHLQCCESPLHFVPCPQTGLRRAQFGFQGAEPGWGSDRLNLISDETAEAFHDLLFFSPPPSCSTEVREQRDEHPAVQLLSSPLLAAKLHGRFHLVPALCRRER